MSKTIVQDYGPIYGEAVNGTVQGRPNGSVFVPLSNTIALTLDEDYQYVKLEDYGGGNYYLRLCDSAGVEVEWNAEINMFHSVAKSQDLASYMEVQIYSDALLTTIVAFRDYTAGQFNRYGRDVYAATSAISVGDTLYLRAQLMNNANAIATSDVITLEVVS